MNNHIRSLILWSPRLSILEAPTKLSRFHPDRYISRSVA